MGGEMDRWEKLGGLGNISLSIYFVIIHSVVFKIALFDQFASWMSNSWNSTYWNCRKNSNCWANWIKTCGFYTSWIFVLNFATFCFAILHFAFCILKFCTPGVFFDFGVLEYFFIFSIGVSPSWVGQRKDEKRSVPYNVEKSIFNFQLVANCSLCITCSVCAMG